MTPGGYLDDALESLGVERMEERHPVLAIGSNASPAQLRHKLTTRHASSAVPMIQLQVSGISAGVSGHVATAGYIPAAPITVRGDTSTLFALWLDSTQLQIIDDTEPNFDRRALPPDEYPVRQKSGPVLQQCTLYTSRRGYLLNLDGSPRRLTAQADLLRGLLDDLPALRRACGATPEQFVKNAVIPTVRDEARRILLAAGLVADQPDLTALPAV